MQAVAYTHTSVRVFILSVQTHAWMLVFAECVAPPLCLRSGNAELVSGENLAIREEYQTQLSLAEEGGGCVDGCVGPPP